MANPFDALKETLGITKVLAFYGVEVKRGNKAFCPLHTEKSPSFTIYPVHNSWHCFGCNTGGTVIDFVMAFYGLDALEAAKKLDADFNLGLFDYEPAQEELKKLSERRILNQAYKGLADTFQAYMNKAFIILCDYFRLLMDWKVKFAPKTPEGLDSVNPLFAEACHQLDYIEYLIDCLQRADYDGQIQFYQTHRKEITAIATKVKRHRSSRKADESA